MTIGKLISKEETEMYERWNLPVVEDVSKAVDNAKHNKSPSLMTAEQIERIQDQAFKEAYAAGFKKGQGEGKASGEKEILNNAKLLDELLESLSQPYKDMDHEVGQQLVNLSISIARQLVRRELKIDPSQIMGVVQEALTVLPVGSRDVKVCLHPDDVLVIKNMLTQSEGSRSWSLVDDPGLMRGDCRILTETSQIDASLDKRLAAIAAKILGGVRLEDESESID